MSKEKVRMTMHMNGEDPVDITDAMEKISAQREKESGMITIGGVAGKRLNSFIERIERLETDKAGISDDIKEVYGEAKGVGFDPDLIRRIVKLRKMDEEKRREKMELLKTYAESIGMQYALLF